VSTQLLSVVPIVGSLGLPVKFAASGSDSTGPSRTASSQAADLGLLGTLGILAVSGAPTLAKLGIPASQFTAAVKLPPASLADSRGAPVADDRPVFPAVPVGPVTVGGGHQHAEAPDGGTATARTELGDATIDLGLLKLRLGGGVSETSANPQLVSATTSLGELGILVQGVQVATLSGLVWHYEQAYGQASSASFSVGSGSFGLTQVQTPDPAQLHQLINALNGVLAISGFTITLPEVRPEGGLTPLRLALVDSPAGGQFLEPLYDLLLSNATNHAEGAIVGGVPESGLALTVANVVFASLTGRGGVAVELGDIAGSIGNLPDDQYTYAPLPTPGGASPSSAPAAAAGASPRGGVAAPGSAPAIATAVAGPPRHPSTAAQLISVITDESFPAVVIILAGLGAAVALWAVDRRRIAAFLAEPR
jgi:hypothetical protein